jgi:WD40 repeat protein
VQRPAAVRPFALLNSLFADLRRSTGAVVIAASGGDEFALEQSGNGVFTSAVLAGLTNAVADLNHDGRVQVTELQDFVTKLVTQLTKGRQTPTARRLNRDVQLAFAPQPGLLYSMFTPSQTLSSGDATISWTRFSRDGMEIIRRNVRGIEFWATHTGRLRRVLPRGVELSPLGDIYVVDDNYDKTLTLCDVSTGAERHRMQHGGDIYALTFSPDGKLLATGGVEGILRLWDVVTGSAWHSPAPGLLFLTWCLHQTVNTWHTVGLTSRGYCSMWGQKQRYGTSREPVPPFDTIAQ